MKETAYQAALYLRLSKDDEGYGESASIQSQRKILRQYAAEKGFCIYDEYIDDGFSGTNFDRPGFARMLADIERGMVNMVLAKDLSRLGRDYITAGEFTERYFPQHRVRFIAVGDGYDSACPHNDIAPFRHVINEMYARDTSVKIRSALRAKMEEGCFIGHFAPYGYRKDPANKNHLLPDDKTAPVVRAIFAQAADNKRPSEIAASLNHSGILSPLQYRNLHRSSCSNPSPNWSSSAICKLLKNKVYLGHTIQGKSAKLSFKSCVVLSQPEEDWFFVPNTHEPLVSEALFEAAGARVVARRSSPRSGFRNLFAGLAFCADCGSAMSLTAGTRGAYQLVCGRYKAHGKSACSNHFTNYDALVTTVRQELRRALSLSPDQQQELIAQLQRSSSPMQYRGSRTSLQNRMAQLDSMIRQLYDDRANRILPEERFSKLYHSCEAEYQDLKAKSALSTPLASSTPDSWQQQLAGLQQLEHLTPALLRRLIHRVAIHQGIYADGVKHQSIRLTYRFCVGTPYSNNA